MHRWRHDSALSGVAGFGPRPCLGGGAGIIDVRCGEGRREQGVRGLAEQLHRGRPVEAADVDEPYERLDAHGGADGDREPVHVHAVVTPVVTVQSSSIRSVALRAEAPMSKDPAVTTPVSTE